MITLARFMDNQATMLRWLIYKQEDEKFPYLLCIEQERDNFLCLGVQEKWPGPGKKIFCQLKGNFPVNGLPGEEPVEQCRIIKLHWYGRRLVIILDRKVKKRCWFVFIKKEYKTKPGAYYDQVFWITQSADRVRRPGAYIPRIKEGSFCEIIIDQRERYAYKFGYAHIKRENLPVGDYALIKDGKIFAVAERKNLHNFLSEIGLYDTLKARLEELATYRYKALVFESPYSDFLNPEKIKPYSAVYLAEILSDLMVRFPDIQFIFCDNRKFAQEWLYRWFLRINAED
ncbi:MAG: ERCC4 domain-containing protein [bacterium]